MQHPLNPVLARIHAHRSVRRYRPDPVPELLLERVLAAALRASSSGNMQTFSVIASSDPELRARLGPAHFGQSMVQEAPLLLTFCADLHRMRRWLALREAPENFDNFMSFLIGAIDAVLAAQNAALAAESEGLGLCFLGTTLASCDEIARILGCPAHVVPVVGFTLGYPAEEPALRDRLPLGAVLHRERYHDPCDSELLAHFREREEAGWRRYMENPELRASVEEGGARNLAQLYTRIKYTRESHEEYSRIVQGCLERQGFLRPGVLSASAAAAQSAPAAGRGSEPHTA